MVLKVKGAIGDYANNNKHIMGDVRFCSKDSAKYKSVRLCL